MSNSIICANLTGVCFKRIKEEIEIDHPYNEKLNDLMCDICSYLMSMSKSAAGYVSHESINLLIDTSFENYYHGNTVHASIALASLASAYLNKKLPTYFPNIDTIPRFDCLSWHESKAQAVNCLTYAELKGTQNSLLRLIPKEQLNNENSHDRSALVELIEKNKIDWNGQPEFFKYGTLFKRKTVEMKFTEKEIEEFRRRGKKHKALDNPDILVRRSVYEKTATRISLIQNKENFIFSNETPILRGTLQKD